MMWWRSSALWEVADLSGKREPERFDRIPSREEMRAALAERHGEEIQRAVEKASVAVCGLGGLGSNVAVALARAGVGRLHLIDFDEVDITNLNRQQYDACQTGRSKTDALKENLLRISPYISIETDNTRITEENAAEDKAMLVNFLLEKHAGKVCGSCLRNGRSGVSQYYKDQKGCGQILSVR